MKWNGVRTGPGKPGNFWNFIMAFSRTGNRFLTLGSLGRGASLA